MEAIRAVVFEVGLADGLLHYGESTPAPLGPLSPQRLFAMAATGV